MNRRDLISRLGTATVFSVAGAVLAGCLGSIDPSGDDGDVADSDGGSGVNPGSDDEPYERHELGDVDTVESPSTLIVRNEDDSDRDVELVVEPASGDDELDRTIELPPDQTIEVVIADPDGFEVSVESDGSTSTTSIGRSDSGDTETTIVLTEDGVQTETDSTSVNG